MSELKDVVIAPDFAAVAEGLLGESFTFERHRRIEAELRKAFVAGQQSTPLHRTTAPNENPSLVCPGAVCEKASLVERLKNVETVGVALERRHTADLAAVAEGLAAGFALANVQTSERPAAREWKPGDISRPYTEEPPRPITAQAALVLLHEWVVPHGGVAPECPHCGGVKPDPFVHGEQGWRDDLRPRGHEAMGMPCAWGLLCEQLRHPIITEYLGMGVNFLMGERAEAGMIVTMNENGHIVPRSKL